MSRHHTGLEWHVGEDKYIQQTLSLSVPTKPGTQSWFDEHRFIVLIMRSLSLLLSGMSVAQSITFSSEQPLQIPSTIDDSPIQIGKHEPQAPNVSGEIYAEIQALLTTEENAWREDRYEQFDSLVDPAVDNRWRRKWSNFWKVDVAERTDLGVSILDIKAVDTLIQVELLVERVPTEWLLASPYRETRFYRRLGKEWARTLPNVGYWGIQHIVETEHLRFKYRQWDAHAIAPMLETLEHTYLALHDQLEISPPDKKLTLALVPKLDRGWALSGDLQEFTSPILVKRPDGLSDQDFTAHLIVRRMFEVAITNTSYGQRRSHSYLMDTMLWAYGGWLRTELLQQRTPWQHNAEVAFAKYSRSRLPLQLHDITPLLSRSSAYREQLMLRYGFAESLMAYTAQTYQAENPQSSVIPQLLEGLRTYQSWAELIPGVFDVTIEEFERGWNHYLAERYAIDVTN